MWCGRTSGRSVDAAPEDIEEGVYLEDGTRLYRVLRTWLPNGQVLLEDAGDPSLPALVRTVSELIADGMQVVRPLTESRS